MNKCITSGKIYVSKSTIPNAGRGVFALNDIKKGEIIERCPVLQVPENDVSNLNGSFLVTYFYYLGKDKNKIAFALGFGSLYNHTYKPNAQYKGNEKDTEIKFIALYDIKKDEEITVNYNQGKIKNKNPLWFEE